MSFAFRRRESATHAVRRLLRRQLAEAVAALRAPDAAGVHRARVRLKRARAVLRLAHDLLPGKPAADADRRLRTVGRQLGAARDAVVVLAALRALDPAGGRRWARLRADLATGHRVAARALPGLAGPIAVDLRALRAAIADWRLRGGWKRLATGVTRMQARCARALAAAGDRDDEALHAWRRQAKRLAWQVGLFKPARPRQVAPLVRRLERIGSALGEDHDLAVLGGLLAGRREPPAACRALLRTIASRRRIFQDEAFALGRRAHAGEPKALARRLLAWLRAWRAGGRRVNRGCAPPAANCRSG